MKALIIKSLCFGLLLTLQSLPVYAVDSCQALFVAPTSVDFNNKIDFLRESEAAMATGLMQSRYDSALDTRFYFAGTAVPNARTGVQPMIDPKAKAVYVMVHGSGTIKSSGKNFTALMNTLGQMGYSAVSFDLPFHSEGPRSQTLNRLHDYNIWIDRVMAKVRSEAGDKPVYLVGHSFGPDVIMEYLMNHPKSVKGAALLSPAGFDKVLDDWYVNHTEKMNFGGDVAENVAGGEWSAEISRQFKWNKNNGAKDPTVANPDLKLRMLTGDHEEYVPAPLNEKGLPSGKNTYDMREAFRKHARNAEVTVEEGVGHYIFAHKDTKGRNVVLRELLALEGVDSKNEGAIIGEHHKSKTVQLDETLNMQYTTDRLFRSWVDQVYGSRAFQNAIVQRNEGLLKKLDRQYRDAKFAAEESIRADILALAERDLVFYEKYRSIIDGIRSGKLRGDTSLFPGYLAYLRN